MFDSKKSIWSKYDVCFYSAICIPTKFSFGGQQVVAEHVLFGSIVVPGVVYTEMALEAVRRGAAARRD